MMRKYLVKIFKLPEAVRLELAGIVFGKFAAGAAGVDLA